MPLGEAVEILEAATKFRRLALYRPYSKQREFHRLGATHRERALLAGNQLGKSYCGAAEMAMHLTGQYPEWWEGRVFHRPIRAWACGVSNEQTRETAQALLFGTKGDNLQTGMVPGNAILDFTWAKGVSDFLDTVIVHHERGGHSTLKFRSYEQAREKWQGPPIDYMWLDEEAPKSLYIEAQARTTATKGSIANTFTPLLGMSEVVRYFYPKPNARHRAIVRMTIEDAEHIATEDRQAEIDKYPEHEREARIKGIPTLGEGAVFPVPESQIIVPAFKVPDHFRWVAGIDFGWSPHPAAIAWVAWDPDTDLAYVVDTWTGTKQSRSEIAMVLLGRPNGRWTPVAWPHDGHKEDRGTGVPEAQAYRALGVPMLPEHSCQKNGSIRIEPWVQSMLDRMRTGKLKVFGHLEPWLEEFRLYHRKEGKIVREHDDLLSATRYAIACLSASRSRSEGRSQPRRVPDYEPLGR